MSANKAETPETPHLVRKKPRIDLKAIIIMRIEIIATIRSMKPMLLAIMTTISPTN